jgi:hypothetical protein
MCTVKSLSLFVALLPAAAVLAGAEHLLEQLRLDHAAWTAAERDFRERRESGSLTGTEASDYAGYVARLQRRVAEDCAATAGAGVPVPADMACPQFAELGLTGSAPINQAAEQTREEKLAGMDAKLAAGLGEFDELLLREQERVKAKAAASRAASGGGSGEAGSSGAESTGAAAGSAARSAEARSGAVSTGEGNQGPVDGAGSGSTASAGGGPAKIPLPGARRLPPGIPDGSDDDVVARQLREAAEKETDPELQKKLWEEYRKYKQGIR